MAFSSAENYFQPMEDHVMQCLLTPLNVWAPEWSIWTSASKQDNLNEPLECVMGVRVGRGGKMWAGYEVRECSWGRQITKGKMLWGKKLGKLTKKLGCPKGWPESNFLTFVTAKRLENFISMDWPERENTEFPGSIPLFKLLWELEQLCPMRSPSSVLLGIQVGTTDQGPNASYKQSYFTFKLMLDGFGAQVNWFLKSMLNQTLLNSFSTTPLSKWIR